MGINSGNAKQTNSSAGNKMSLAIYKSAILGLFNFNAYLHTIPTPSLGIEGSLCNFSQPLTLFQNSIALSRIILIFTTLEWIYKDSLYSDFYGCCL